MKTEIYANLNKGGISVRQSGKVVDVVNYAVMIDVNFVVNRSGYERTVRENQRNVHAFARGTLTDMNKQPIDQNYINALRNNFKRISYNPFRSDKFTVNGQPIDSAKRVIMVLTERKNERNRPLCELFLMD